MAQAISSVFFVYDHETPAIKYFMTEWMRNTRMVKTRYAELNDDTRMYYQLFEEMNVMRATVFLHDREFTEEGIEIPKSKKFKVMWQNSYMMKANDHMHRSFHVELAEAVVPWEIKQTENVFLWEKFTLQSFIKDITTGPLTANGYLAFGLAWTFYIGYLSKIANGFSEGMEVALQNSENLWHKLMVVIPKSAYCPNKVIGCTATDKCIERKMTVGGVTGRSFKHSIYSITNYKGKTVHVAAEYATPVRALMKIAQYPGVWVPKLWLQTQSEIFANILQELSAQYGMDEFLSIIEFHDVDCDYTDEKSYSDNHILQDRMRAMLFDTGCGLDLSTL